MEYIVNEPSSYRSRTIADYRLQPVRIDGKSDGKFFAARGEHRFTVKGFIGLTVKAATEMQQQRGFAGRCAVRGA
jgi:hypothetical protein